MARHHSPSSSTTRGGAARPSRAGRLVSQALEAAPSAPRRRRSAPEVKRDDSLPEFVVRIERKSSYKQGAWLEKSRSLKKLSDEGKLFKQANPVARNGSITRGYKARVESLIKKKYDEDDPMRDKLLTALKKTNPDHVWELQLGGADDRSNLKLLDGHTNQDIGREIRKQIAKLPNGTPIRIEVVD
ncbi:endonuclease [Actinoplanes sp. NPDC051851]|uniref:endonuclease n=1 Tax=Actinoplanes sp. NPDC051851 TaxID=3154753 RepID=UPI00342EE8B3